MWFFPALTTKWKHLIFDKIYIHFLFFFMFILEVILLLFCRTILPNFLLETIIIVLYCKTCTFCLNCKRGALLPCQGSFIFHNVQGLIKLFWFYTLDISKQSQWLHFWSTPWSKCTWTLSSFLMAYSMKWKHSSKWMKISGQDHKQTFNCFPWRFRLTQNMKWSRRSEPFSKKTNFTTLKTSKLVILPQLKHWNLNHCSILCWRGLLWIPWS